MSADAAGAAPPPLPPLTGSALVIGTIALSLATFMNVLDTSIANVSIPAIAGDLGVSPDQGTWVITSFGVANAISLPLTGWLTRRFGQVRLFTASVVLFVIASFLCALAPTLSALILFRVLQGAVAGPMIPLSQSLLLASYPKNRAGTALAMWAITTLVAPVVGPLLGGWITDNISWPWIFYINVPVGIAAAGITWMIFRKRETPTARVPVDTVGLGLLVLWVGALQIMLDKGKDLDWFHSTQIVSLAGVAAVTFVVFLIWELTEEHPIVDLSLFKRRNFWVATLALLSAYGLYFGNVVLLPLWLQQYMGYTATLAGLVLAPVGLLAIFFTPFVGRFSDRFDPRILVTISFGVFSLVLFMRAQFNTDATIGTLADSDPHSGRRPGGVLHPAHVALARGTAPGAHSGGLRTFELRPHYGGLLRNLDHDDALGPPRHAASCAAGRTPESERPGDCSGPGSAARGWRGHGSELRAAESHGRFAGLHALRERYLLRVGHHFHRADRSGVARPPAARRCRGRGCGFRRPLKQPQGAAARRTLGGTNQLSRPRPALTSAPNITSAAPIFLNLSEPAEASPCRHSASSCAQLRFVSHRDDARSALAGEHAQDFPCRRAGSQLRDS